ncbi:MAG: type II toxin-antitoxin system death-on-curing family toxin [Holophaga sp.]|nr:type II toxin-antitoxin system death-on-curing family toxin [Holophaga sp.]
MILLTLEQVHLLHEDQILRFGGLPGINDPGLVESAVNAVVNRICYQNCTDPIELASVYLYRLVSNHGFLDGNKRVGMAAALVFLRLNGFRTDFPEFEEITLGVAAGLLDEGAVVGELRGIYRRAGIL